MFILSKVELSQLMSKVKLHWPRSRRINSNQRWAKSTWVKG